MIYVAQIANFLPRDEEEYEKEFAHFKQELENLYPLCFACDAAVKSRLVGIDKTCEKIRSARGFHYSDPAKRHQTNISEPSKV